MWQANRPAQRHVTAITPRESNTAERQAWCPCKHSELQIMKDKWARYFAYSKARNTNFKSLHLPPSDQSVKINLLNELDPGQTGVWSSSAAASQSRERAPVALLHLVLPRTSKRETRMRVGALYPFCLNISSVVLYVDHLKNLALSKNGICAIQLRCHNFEKLSCFLLLHIVLLSLISIWEEWGSLRRVFGTELCSTYNI